MGASVSSVSGPPIGGETYISEGNESGDITMDISILGPGIKIGESICKVGKEQISCKYKKELHPFKDILDQTITGVHFATCPLRGWFLDHWALVLERGD